MRAGEELEGLRGILGGWRGLGGGLVGVRGVDGGCEGGSDETGCKDDGGDGDDSWCISTLLGVVTPTALAAATSC